MQEWRREREHGEFMLAQLTAATINYGACRPKEPVAAKELMPSQWGAKTRKRRRWKPRKQVAQEVRGIMDHFRRHFGGNPSPGA